MAENNETNKIIKIFLCDTWIIHIVKSLIETMKGVKMKHLIILCSTFLWLFLVACAKEPLPTLEPLPPNSLLDEPMCDYLFNSWEQEKARGSEGLYFRIGEKEALIFVMDSEVGLHELGHFVDMERDYPSRTQAFKDAVDEFLSIPSDLQETFTFWLEIGLGMDDIYAELYKISLIGELPPIFEPFFDQYPQEK